MTIILDPRDEDVAPTTAAEKRFDDGTFSLPFFDSKYHIIRETNEVESGFLAGLFGFSADHSYATVIHEVRQYDKIINDRGKKVNWGVALRLIAISKTTGLDFDISIPNFAAAGQLGQLDTSATISTIGFGAIPGDLAPTPEKLDVDSFVELNSSFEKLQKLIFGEKSRTLYIPREIEYTG